MNLFDLCVYKNLNKGSGGDVDVSSLVATENKTYNAGEGKAYNPVVVNVPTPSPSLQSLTASHNGYFVPSSGYDGFSEVNVEVATPLETLSATENGTYTPSSGYEGFSEVTVDVPLPNNAYLLESQKDDVVTIQHGAEFDMPKLIASIEPQQSGSGDPSPENVRPISGWTACNVVRTGKNLFDVANTATIYPKLKQGQTIYAKQNSSNDFGLYVLYEGDSQSTALQLNSNTKASMVLTKDVVQIAISDNARNALISQGKDIMVSTTDFTDIEPYNGNTYTINFVDGSSPLTVYGGTLDVLSGVLTVDKIFGEFDGVDESWTNIGAGSVGNRSNVLLNAFPSTDIDTDFVAICNTYIGRSYNDRTFNTSNVVWANPNGSLTVVTDSDIDTAEKFKTLLQNTPLQVIVKLATPQTYQLTPTQVIKSLLGVNNIFADTGKVDVQIWTKEVTS